MNETVTKFEKVKKKYALNNSYFKNRTNSMPSNPMEIMQYYKEHNDLPFDMGTDTSNWLYECYIEFQKRSGVYNSQFFTPPKTAIRMYEIGEDYFDLSENVLDACSGFGMLSKPFIVNGYTIEAFDYSSDMMQLYKDNFNCEYCTQLNFLEQEFADNYYNIISNPPYEVPALTSFLNWIYENMPETGVAVLLIPKGFLDKERPKAIPEIVSKFKILHREDMQEDFARTKIRAEIVVLKK